MRKINKNRFQNTNLLRKLKQNIPCLVLDARRVVCAMKDLIKGRVWIGFQSEQLLLQLSRRYAKRTKLLKFKHITF